MSVKFLRSVAGHEFELSLLLLLLLLLFVCSVSQYAFTLVQSVALRSPTLLQLDQSVPLCLFLFVS